MSGNAWTMERIEELKRSGEWFADERWRAPAYVANSPFTPQEHEQIFGALALVYTPRRAQEITARTRPSQRFMPQAQPPLFDPWAAHASFAVALGADLSVVRPWEAPRCRDLMNGLVRNPAQFSGARLELEVHAALLRAGIEAERGEGLDLRARLHDAPLMVEIALVDFGDGADAEMALLNHLQLGSSSGERAGMPRSVPGHVILLETLRDLPTQDRVRLLKDEVARDALREKVLAAADQLVADAGEFVVVDGIVRIERETGWQGDVTSVGSCPPADVPRETRRLLGVLRKKAKQVGRHAKGDAVVWLDIGMRLGEPTPYVAPIQEWLASADGTASNRVVGVVLVADYFDPDFHDVLKWPCVVPDARLTQGLGTPETWRAIWCGLNWFRLRRAVWKRQRVSSC